MSTFSQAEVGLANPQMPQSPEPKERDLKEVKECVGLRAGMPSWDELTGRPHFRVGIILDSSSTVDRHIRAMSKPATPCTCTSVVVLHPQPDEVKAESMQRWFKCNRLDSESDGIDVGWGQQGMEELFESDVDAVYIIVPPGSQREYVLEALKAGKHVLLNDPLSTSMSEFIEQQTLAKKYGKMIQFLTMFVHQFKTKRFINKVLGDEEFGWIHSIDAHANLCYDDVEKVGVKTPLQRGDGSIRVLGRFCVLVSTLFFSQCGSRAKSAKVEKIVKGENGEIVSATCVVHFTEGRNLRFHVEYTHSATRQSIELEAADRFATMNDFIIEHPDGLATYRVYEKAKNATDKIEVTHGEAIDLAGGPTQNTMMWRTFVSLCNSLDRQGGWDQSEDTKECRVLANVALQTKRILIALMKSIENSFEEVVIDDIDYQ